MLIADARNFARQGLRATLRDDRRCTIVAETGDDPVPLAAREHPDIIVCDPRAAEEEACRRIAALACAVPECRVVVFSDEYRLGVALATIRAGARGYLLKTDPDPALLRDALYAIGRHGAVVSDLRLYERFRARLGGEIVFRPTPPDTVALTPREREVITLLANGLDDHAVGERLCITASTVQSHVQHLCATLRAETRLHLGVLAERYGLSGDEAEAAERPV